MTDGIPQPGDEVIRYVARRGANDRHPARALPTGTLARGGGTHTWAFTERQQAKIASTDTGARWFQFQSIAAGIQAFSILNTLVPHTGHTPRVAGLRFLSMTRLVFLISTFFLHFMQ